MDNEAKIPRNPELALDKKGGTDEEDGFNEDQLRDTGKREILVTPFLPIILEYYEATADQPARPKSGICGRDEHNNPTWPETMAETPLIHQTTGEDIANPTVASVLKEHDLSSWKMFKNPPAKLVEERDLWWDK
ncbi:MAG: hypothetical protein V1846_03500 [Candidatus Komeilibacteria bacterium]